MFKKILKWTLGSFLVLLLTLIAVIGTLVLRPQIVINDHNLHVAAHLAARKGIDVSWKHAEIKIASPSFAQRGFDFKFRGLCYRSPGMNSCFDEIRLAFVADFTKLIPTLSVIGPIDALGGRIKITSNPSQTSQQAVTTKKKEGSTQMQIPRFIRDAKVEPIRVGVDEWTYDSIATSETGASHYSGNLTAEGSERNGRLLLLAKGLGHLMGRELDFSGRVESNPAGKKLDFKIGGNLVQKATKTNPASKAVAGIQGDLTEQGIHSVINLEAKKFSVQVPYAALKGCKLDLIETKANVDCPIVAKFPLPPKKFEVFKVPTQIGMRLIADLRDSGFPPMPDHRVEGNVELKIDPVLTPIFQGQGDIKTILAGVPTEFPRDWKLDTDLSLKMLLPKFETLVAALAKTDWAVPAPLLVLKGSSEFDVTGKMDINSGKIPLKFNTRLTSLKQTLNVDADGVFALSQIRPVTKSDLKLHVVLSDIQLELPKLDIGAPPRFVKDKRIVKKTATSATATGNMTYAVTVTTPGAKPLRILSNLAKAPIPIALDLAMDNRNPLSGTVQVADFPLEVFKREATLDHFDMQMKDPPEESRIDGAVKIAYTDYTITILLLGTTGKPTIKFLSDPPLPESQVMAVLLFGRTLDELDPDQASSVGNTRAAVADGAIGLASLYALASTPVQSVGYDPTTGVVSAKVRLGEGTSLNVGADSTQLANVGIKKRLGPHWSITTDLNHPSGTESRTVSAFLEWAHRY